MTWPEVIHELIMLSALVAGALIALTISDRRRK